MLIEYSTLTGRGYGHHGFAALEGDVQPSLFGNSCRWSASARLGENNDLGESLLVSKSALLCSFSLVSREAFDESRQYTKALPSIIKCSLLAFYSRFLVSRKARWLLCSVVGALVIFTLGFILVSSIPRFMALTDYIAKTTIFGRNPVKAVWYPFEPQYDNSRVCTCKLLSVIYSSFHAFIDFLILVIPIPILWGLKINKRTKGIHCKLWDNREYCILTQNSSRPRCCVYDWIFLICNNTCTPRTSRSVQGNNRLCAARVETDNLLDLERDRDKYSFDMRQFARSVSIVEASVQEACRV